jgi:hypothetical protein
MSVVEEKVAYYRAKPAWWLYLVGAGLLGLIIYGGWIIWDLKHPKIPVTGVTTNAPLTEEFEDLETETTTTTTTYYPDKNKAEQKLGIPITNNPKELLVTGSEIAPNKYGAKTAVYHNISSAGYRTAIKYNDSPLFSFKRDWAIGIGGGVTTQGRIAAGRVRLDVVQIKEVTLSPEFEGNFVDTRKEPLEGRAMLWAEWRR